jgi:ATP-dependent DNA helicase RecQ
VDNIELILKQYFGYDTFLPGQRDIIDQAVARRDAFVLMPTGADKSLTNQFSALLLPELTVVISPLIALMHDQIDRLKTYGLCSSA